MAKSAYIGVDGTAQKVKKMFVGVEGVARKVKKAWIGVDGVARLFYSSSGISKLPTFTGGDSSLTGDEEKGSIECYGSGILSLGDGVYDVFAVGGGGGGGALYGSGAGGGYTTTKKNITVVDGDYGVFIGAGGSGGVQNTTSSINTLIKRGTNGGSTSIIFDQKLSGSLPSSTDSVIVMNNDIKDKLNYALPTVSGSYSYITTGKSGGGVKLNDGYIDTNKQYDLSQYFTVCGWFRRTGELTYTTDDDGSYPTYMGLFNQAFHEYDGGSEDDGTGGYDYYSGIRLWLEKTGTSTSSTKLRLLAGISEGKDYEGSISNAESLFPLNTWVHVAMVKENTCIKVYINGVKKITSETFPSNLKFPLASPSMVIGGDRTGWSSTTVNCKFKGDVDEVIISEDTAFWTADFTPPVLSYDNNQFTTITTVRANGGYGGGGGYYGTGGSGGSGGGGAGYDNSDDASHSAGGAGGSGGNSGSNGMLSGGSGQWITTRPFFESSGIKYSGGGGGAGGYKTSTTSFAGGAGGEEGGGSGATYSTAPGIGHENTGGGGGGGAGGNNSSYKSGAAGGSGLIIVRWGYENNFVLLDALTVGSTVRFKREDGHYMNFIVVQKGKPSDLYDSSCDGIWLLKDSNYKSMTAGYTKYAISNYHKTYRNDFEALLDKRMMNAIPDVKIPYVNGEYADGIIASGSNGLQTKSFLLSAKEIGSTVANLLVDGTCLTYFNDSSTNTERNDNGSTQLTRSPSQTTNNVVTVSATGIHTTTTRTTSRGTRPALILPKNTFYVDKAQNLNILTLEG